MASKNTIRVSEFEKLYYDNSKPFKQKHWEALCRYQEQQYKKGESGIEYFRILNKGVQFTNYVGVIQAGSLTIEVLPKTDKRKTTAANLSVAQLETSDNETSQSKQCWHNVLLQMLKECRLLQINHVDYASLNLKSNSILEIYLELFLTETEKLLHEGLIKKYREAEGNQLAMKGQLLFSKNITRNLVHKERFYVRYTEYNRNNIFNRILYKTLCQVPTLTANPFLSDKVSRLLLDFPEMPDCKVTADTFTKLFYDRKSQRYQEAMLISKMLLLNYRPDITGGSENVMAILFDMNALWEEFVYRRLKKSAEPGTNIQRQQKKDFWWNSQTNYSKKIRPDIIITKDAKTVVVDTKWKIVDYNNPADDDLKQMFVYNLFWDADRSILLYPGSLNASDGSFYHCSLSNPQKKDLEEIFYNHCSLVFLNVLQEDKLIDNTPFIQFLAKL